MCWQGYGKKGTLCTVGGNADWCSHCGKQYGRSSKNLKWNCILHSDPTSGNISEETQNSNSKEHKHAYSHWSVIYSCQDMKAAQVSISRWVDKTTVGHLHNGILLSHKKEEKFTLCNSTNRPGEHYSKWNKPVRKRQILYDFTHMWTPMNKMN